MFANNLPSRICLGDLNIFVRRQTFSKPDMPNWRLMMRHCLSLAAPRKGGGVSVAQPELQRVLMKLKPGSEEEDTSTTATTPTQHGTPTSSPLPCTPMSSSTVPATPTRLPRTPDGVPEDASTMPATPSRLPRTPAVCPMRAASFHHGMHSRHGTFCVHVDAIQFHCESTGCTCFELSSCP